MNKHLEYEGRSVQKCNAQSNFKTEEATLDNTRPQLEMSMSGKLKAHVLPLFYLHVITLQ